FLAAGLVMREIPFFHEGRPVARLCVEGIDSPFPAKLVLPQRDTERILLGHVEAAGVRVERGCELVSFRDRDGAVAATLRGPDGRAEEVGARWLVGCDGFHSAVRTAAGVPFEGEDYPGLWAIVDARLEGWPYADDQIPVFLGEDGFWAMRLPGGWVRLFFRHADAAPLPGLDEVNRVLARYVSGTPRVLELTGPATFRLHFRVAQRFRIGRVFLAGDAAHVCTPVGGEGMNTGMQDAGNLAWKLALAAAGHAGDVLLDSYDPERRAVDAAAARASDEGQRGSLMVGAEAQAER